MTQDHLVYAPYHPETDGEARRLFHDYTYKDYQLRFMGASKKRMVDFLVKSLRQPDVKTVCLRERDRLIGLVSIKPLPWLSSHFGFRMFAVAHLLARGGDPLVQARLLRYMTEEIQEVDFLDCRIAANDINSAHALEICGFRYVGTEIYLGRTIERNHGLAYRPLFKISAILEESELDQVREIAGEIHTHNRFSYDPFFREEDARSVYQRLLANCIGDDQFDLLVARSPARIEGFIVSKFNRPLSRELGFRCASLDFIGVRREIQNRGLGQALSLGALEHLAREKVTFVGVRTMASNYSALMVCTKTGFQLTSASLHFHKWIYRPRATSTVSPIVLPSFESINSRVLFGEEAPA
jgi:ribosomal protein S18 acetylase RimI-like enzyme